ncbi:hypothetical protein MPSEU_000189700 [Mayamaea pseudoterrestris]|nr:hypothetical protein MPSEU_000189700 [Mayamaea pseudoterrestris]
MRAHKILAAIIHDPSNIERCSAFSLSIMVFSGFKNGLKGWMGKYIWNTKEAEDAATTTTISNETDMPFPGAAPNPLSSSQSLKQSTPPIQLERGKIGRKRSSPASDSLPSRQSKRKRTLKRDEEIFEYQDWPPSNISASASSSENAMEGAATELRQDAVASLRRVSKSNGTLQCDNESPAAQRFLSAHAPDISTNFNPSQTCVGAASQQETIASANESYCENFSEWDMILVNRDGIFDSGIAALCFNKQVDHATDRFKCSTPFWQHEIVNQILTDLGLMNMAFVREQSDGTYKRLSRTESFQIIHSTLSARLTAELPSAVTCDDSQWSFESVEVDPSIGPDLRQIPPCRRGASIGSDESVQVAEENSMPLDEARLRFGLAGVSVTDAGQSLPSPIAKQSGPEGAANRQAAATHVIVQQKNPERNHFRDNLAESSLNAKACASVLEVEPTTASFVKTKCKPSTSNVLIGRGGKIMKDRFAGARFCRIVALCYGEYARATSEQHKDSIVAVAATDLRDRKITFLRLEHDASWKLVTPYEMNNVLHKEFSLTERNNQDAENSSASNNRGVHRTLPKFIKHNITSLLRSEMSNPKNLDAFNKETMYVAAVGASFPARDIPCGPGTFKNIGNERYTRMINYWGPRYSSMKQPFQGRLVDSILQEIHTQRRRFVERAQGGWVEADEQTGAKKVELALRTWHKRHPEVPLVNYETFDSSDEFSFGPEIDRTTSSDDVSVAEYASDASHSSDPVDGSNMCASQAIDAAAPPIQHALLLNYGVSSYEDSGVYRILPEDPFFNSDDTLNSMEMQLLWLGEESMFCLGALEFDFCFIYWYATEDLRVAIRMLQWDTMTEAEKINSIIRSAWQVRRRFKSGRENVRKMLVQGRRRPVMDSIISQIRIERRMGVKSIRYPPAVSLHDLDQEHQWDGKLD